MDDIAELIGGEIEESSVWSISYAISVEIVTVRTGQGRHHGS